MFSPASGMGPFDREQGERQLALEYLAEAWNHAEDDGVQSASLAHASLFAALATFEYGGRFLEVAGLLNYLAVIDAVDISVGRKK